MRIGPISVAAVAACLLAPVLAVPAVVEERPTPTHSVPSLKVPACPSVGTVTYSKSVPSLDPFPTTKVSLCYSDTAIEITFAALEEEAFFYNASHTTNDPIWAYEVMEAFIAKGTNDPATYLEFEVSPANVTFNAFIFNPSKVRATDRPMDAMFLQTPIVDGLVSTTTTDVKAKTWISKAKIPLGLFNVDDGKACGTEWRMNFFRTVTNETSFPAQLLGAWSPPDEASFHKTPFFGRVKFI